MAIDPIKIEFSNHQFLGDGICKTPIARDMAAMRRCTKCLMEVEAPQKALEGVLQCPNCGGMTLARKFRVRIDARFPAIWQNNPYVEQFDGEPDIKMKVGTGIACKQSNSSGAHITQGFRQIVMLKTGFYLPQGELVPDLHLSEHEKKMPPIVDGRYWVACIGKRPATFTSKFWPPERWQAVVSALPDITFVQVGHTDHIQPELRGPNVINMIGKTQDERTGLRNLFRLVYNSDGCCSLVSSLMHIAGAFHKPCVIPAGAREPVRFEQYPFHRYLANQGSMKCIGPTEGAKTLFEITASNQQDIKDHFRRNGIDLQEDSTVSVIDGAVDSFLVKNADAEYYARYRDGKLTAYDVKYRTHQGDRSCWKSMVDACPNLESGYPKCLMMIGVGDVKNAITSYYEGSNLEPVEELAKISQKKQPVFKMLCNAHSWGGGERSAAWLANRMLLEGFEVQLIPTGGVNKDFESALSPHVKLNDASHPVTEPCELMMVYTNDMVFGFHDRYALLENVQAERKVMVLNYRLGKAGEIDWTKTWDKYIFLCSEMEKVFRERVPDNTSVVLPPPVDLLPFLNAGFGSINRTLHVVRVGSQSSQKFPKNIREVVEQIKEAHPSAKFTFMGGHPSLNDLDYVDCFKEYSQPVLDILRKGTVFWYMLPDGYLDNGPRVIMEAMAAGLPIVCDNRGGAKDRVTPETGWLCDNQDEHVKVFKEITGRSLAVKGEAAKERARSEFDPDRWIAEIIGV